jgi:hypothetical protein
MTDLQQPPPAAPSTPAEAATRLDQLKSDPAWRDGFLSGSGPQAREYRDLTALAAKGDKVDLAMAGVLADGPWQESGHLEMIAATKMFRELGISDATIKQTLTDYQVTQREHDAVAKWKADRMRDSEWVKKWLSGEGEHARDMMLANIALTSTIKKEA